VLTLEGELRKLHSSRTISIPEVIEMIAEEGRPLIIASDVFPAPNSVEKIRRAFNAVPGSPEDIITTEDKIEMAKPFEYSNPHERDAIAAAVSVFRKNKNRFEQIKKKLPPGVNADEAIAQVVRGRSVDVVIHELTKKKRMEPEIQTVKEKTDEDASHFRETLRRSDETIRELKNYQDELKAELEEKGNKIKELEELINRHRALIYRELKKEKEIKIRDKEIAHLRGMVSDTNKRISFLNRRINKLKKMRRLEISGRILPVKIISAFTRDSILMTREMFGIKKDDVILLKDASGGGTMTARMLADFGVRAVIICNEMSHAAEEELFKLNVPVLQAKEVNLQFDSAEDLAMVSPDDIKRAIEEWVRKAEKRRMAAKEEWLESLMGEYRSERRRGIKG